MLSEGQKKIQALLLHLNNAALWILDEPFNALDEQYCTTLSSSITAHCTNGGSVILTSHLPICSKQQVYPIDTITLRCESV
jgi:heme exporter protein A